MKLNKQSLITLVELPPTQFGILNGDLSFDEFSKVRLPARALHVLEGVLRNDGYKNVQSINPLYHGVRGKLTYQNFSRIFNSDVLLLSSITRTSQQSQELGRLYKQNNSRGLVIAGGYDATERTENWLRSVDMVVVGEGEKTFSDLMTRLTQDSGGLEDINGIAYKHGDGIVVTKPRKLLTKEELSELPYPYYDEKTRKYLEVSVMETSRGCPNDCDFCGVTKFNGKKYRTKSTNYVLGGLRKIKDEGQSIFYIDDNFIGTPNRAKRLLEAIANEGLNEKPGVAQVTVKIAKDKELINAMKNANIKILCMGIESINDAVLKELGKPYTAKQNEDAVKILRDSGFWIHGMLMFGGDYDTIETYKENLNWMNKNLDSMQFFAIGPAPGTRIQKRFKDEGRILTEDWTLSDGHYVLVRPKNFTPFQLQNLIVGAYENFYSVKNSLKRWKRSPNRKRTLGLLAYTKLYGGLKRISKSRQFQNHLEFLKSIS